MPASGCWFDISRLNVHRTTGGYLRDDPACNETPDHDFTTNAFTYRWDLWAR
ncbi:hypothetical protein FOTG_19258 [Fusarium oxysporum f. sp. vasinfectum 25433]|uniref:Uncharacterized protein n=1 Tax=Fusarium oxysporum f. sp. vasinfectum 25433 TaxID=1089449 RepID=X0KU85_FUSOX|nr:hypothetical protein FOTG_19258 [Fusarium oxysporum f. sp. vasinfectum 25433]